MLTLTSLQVICLALMLLVVIVAALASDRRKRQLAKEVARLTGKVNGFTLSDLNGDPTVIVQHLRNDANMCDFAGQGDMAARLRGYASFLDRHFTNRRMADELRKVGTAR